MLSIRTVLCPVDFSSNTPRQVDLAANLCKAFDARLVLHHNVVELAIGSGVGWMWAATDHVDTDEGSEQKLQALVARAPAGTRVEVSLTHGPVADAVLTAARDTGADLVVLSAHGTGADTDALVTERVVERAAVPVLAMHRAPEDAGALWFDTRPAGPQRLLVPTDLTPASEPAMAVAFDLARRFPFEVHLLHVLSDTTTDPADANRRLMLAVPPDLANRVRGRVASGSVAHAIARLAAEIGAACIVMGAHTRTRLRRWLRPGAPLSVLHRAPCPIWYVPAVQKDAVRVETGAHAADLVDELQSTAFQYWPMSHLYGVVDSRAEADATLADLVAAGVPKERLHTWCGPAGQAAFVAPGDDRHRAARLWRELERATGERELLDQYAAEVEHGNVCIGVRCGGGRDIVTSILHRHGGHLISYFSLGSVERLSP